MTLFNGGKQVNCKQLFFQCARDSKRLEKNKKETHALVLLRVSGIGKTSLAKSMVKNPLMVFLILEDLKKLDDQHDGLLFDDFCLIYLV